jgi:hypothetical protein
MYFELRVQNKKDLKKSAKNQVKQMQDMMDIKILNFLL